MQMQLLSAILFCTLLLLFGCSPTTSTSSPTPTRTSIPTSTSASTPKPFEKLVLRDVQGFSGGQDLWLYADGRIVVQVVTTPSGEKGLRRYETTATAAELQSVQNLLDQHHFADIKIAQRRGVPDEAHPTITVDYQSGPSVSVMKWANDKNPDFDPVYEELLALVKRVANDKPIFEGRYDWNWASENP